MVHFIADKESHSTPWTIIIRNQQFCEICLFLRLLRFDLRKDFMMSSLRKGFQGHDSEMKNSLTEQ